MHLSKDTRKVRDLLTLLSGLDGSLLLAGRVLLPAVVLTVTALVAAVTRAGAAGRRARAAAVAGGGAGTRAVTAGVLLGRAVAVIDGALTGLVRSAHADVRGVGVALELCVVESSDRLLHVLAVGELHHAVAVSLDISVDHVADLAHEVLQVLPAASAGEVGHLYAVLGSSATATTRLVSATGGGSAVTLGELDTKSVAIEVVTVAAANRILSIPVVIKRDESKRRRASGGLQIDLPDLSVSVAKKQLGLLVLQMTGRKEVRNRVLVKKVVQLGLLDVKGKVTNVDSVRHDDLIRELRTAF